MKLNCLNMFENMREIPRGIGEKILTELVTLYDTILLEGNFHTVELI